MRPVVAPPAPESPPRGPGSDVSGFLGEIAPLRYADENGRTPVSDLQIVAGARRVVLPNSTFSYWAAYIGEVLHGADHQVVAPAFFRHDEPMPPHLLRDTWNVVDDIPGGWARV